MSEQFAEDRERYLAEPAMNYEEALALARSIHFTKMIGWVLFNAGEIYAMQGQLNKAVRYSTESRKIFSIEYPNERGLSGVEMLDAIIFMKGLDYANALESIDRSIHLREREKEPRRIADAIALRGDIHMASGKIIEAAENYRNAHAIYQSIGSDAGVSRMMEKLMALE